LGQYDTSTGLRFHINLYGREYEIEQLISGFEKAANGSSQLLLVSGYSGIGKSSLIPEIRKPVTEKKGYFISGKFNQFEKNIPYFGITQSFRELVTVAFTIAEYVDNWKQKILKH
jgi:predicted ATPase